jgi:hypothetical protein
MNILVTAHGFFPDIEGTETATEIYCRRHREKGRSHADALRRLGQRWLKIIHRMWMDRKPYDAMLHNQNQLRHGSWVLQLKAI